jgi:ABC-type glycerol-3-phosphate transport system permease component
MAPKKTSQYWRRLRTKQQLLLHLTLLFLALLTLIPFGFVINNALRSTAEQERTYFGLPQDLKNIFTKVPIEVQGEDLQTRVIQPSEAPAFFLARATRNFRLARDVLRPYFLNTFFVCGVTVCCVLLFGSIVAYLLSRYRFPGHRALYFFIIATMMFPAVLMLVPSFMLVRQLGLLNSYWALILPYIAGGQVFAIFVFKGFFDGLPEELFESARIDGAGHFHLYTNIVLPLSKPVLSVVAIMNILGTWNNFMWPFVTNTDDRYHVLASGLYVLARSPVAQNPGSIFAAYVLASLPLLLLFVLATKPFIQGVTSGAFKA